MANKVINTILNLRDNMSGGLIKAARNTKGVSKEMMSATRSVVAFKNKAVSSITSATKSFVKLGTATAGVVATLAAKTGLSEAMDLEGYRLQLETATKDTQKASEIMQYAINLANKTPFEGGELVEGASKFEAMGMAAQKWLPLAGDMAAATNKSFDQATEALIDAQNGELERLKEFGITKAKIVEQGEKMFSGVQLVNNQGQIDKPGEIQRSADRPDAGSVCRRHGKAGHHYEGLVVHGHRRDQIGTGQHGRHHHRRLRPLRLGAGSAEREGAAAGGQAGSMAAGRYPGPAGPEV